jgi:hypothetical protein
MRHRDSPSAHRRPQTLRSGRPRGDAFRRRIGHETKIAIHLSRPKCLTSNWSGSADAFAKSADELVKRRPVMQMQVDAQTSAKETFRKSVSWSLPTRAAGDQNQRQQRQRPGGANGAGIGVFPTHACTLAGKMMPL